MQRFDFSLTPEDIELTTRFMMLLADDHKEFWCSDDFRSYHLDDEIADKQHGIGCYFSKLKFNRVAVAVGELASEIDSNNRRKVDLFKFDWARWRSILRSRLIQ